MKSKASKKVGVTSEPTIEVRGYTVRQAAVFTGLSVPSLLKEVHENKTIPFRRVGKRIIISKAILELWLQGKNFKPAKAKK